VTAPWQLRLLARPSAAWLQADNLKGKKKLKCSANKSPPKSIPFKLANREFSQFIFLKNMSTAAWTQPPLTSHGNNFNTAFFSLH